MIIKSNIEAMQTYANLTKIDTAFNKSLNKISSGLELPKPEFGGGFYAVANDMEAIYKQYTVGASNIQDAVGLLEVAQTTMLQVNDNLLRMTELAQRAATETFNVDQKQEMDQEFNQLMANNSNLLSNARYNEISVFSIGGDALSILVQYGEDRNFIISSYSVTTSALSIDGAVTAISTQAGASNAVTSVAAAVDKMSQLLAKMGAQINFVQQKADIQSEQALQQKAAESRINELDFAKEMKNFTSLQVVLQASNAMVAQANTKAQMVLQLFGG